MRRELSGRGRRLRPIPAPLAGTRLVRDNVGLSTHGRGARVVAFEEAVDLAAGGAGRRFGFRAALADRPRLAAGVYLALVRQLYSAKPAVVLGSAAGALLAGAVASWRAADPWPLALTVLAALLTVSLLPLKRAFERAGPAGDAAAAPWERRWLLVSGGYSLAVGAMAVRAFHVTDDLVVHMIMFAVCLAGVATVLRNFVRPRVLLAQFAGLLVVPLLGLAATGDPTYVALAVAGAALAYNVSQIGLDLYRKTVDGLVRNARFRAALDNMHHGLCMFGADRRLLVHNDRYLELFGFSADVVRPGISTRGILEHSVAIGNHSAEDIDAIHERVVESFSGAQVSFLHAIRDKTLAVTHSPMPDGGWVATFEDITDRLTSEAALRESEEHYRHRVELDPQTAWMVDEHGQMIEISSRWVDYTGQPKAAALGRGWMAAIHPDDLPAVMENSRRATDTRSNNDMTFRLRSASGDYRWFRARAFPRLGPDGRIKRWYGYSEDIHEQVRASDRLRESERKLSTLVGNLPGVAYRSAPVAPWRLEYVSEGTLALTGYAADEFISGRMTWADVMHPDDVEPVDRRIAEALETGERFLETYRVIHRSGEVRWVLERGQPVFSADGELLALEGFIGDISEQKAAEAKLRQLQGELFRVSRVSAMGAMGAAIAHELNQPLAAAANYAAAVRLLLERGSPPLGEVSEAAARVGTEVLRAGEIVRRLRQLVANGEAAVAAEDLAGLVEASDVLALVGARELGVSYRLELAAGVAVAADRIQIQQVLLNLVRNAVEAMRDADRRELVIAATATDAEARIVVQDSGPGIPREVKDHLFEPFSTTKEGGMGIGLSICRTIVEAHGGRIWVEDAPGGGARFAFTLPLAEAMASEARRADAPAA